MIKIIMIGNLTKDPEVRTVNTQNGQKSVATFDLAMGDRKNKNKTTYVRVSAWEKQAEIISKYTAKGDRLCVISDGIEARAYAGKDGPRASLECTAREIELLGGRRSDADEAPDPAEMGKAVQAAKDAATGMTVAEDESLPF